MDSERTIPSDAYSERPSIRNAQLVSEFIDASCDLVSSGARLVIFGVVIYLLVVVGPVQMARDSGEVARALRDAAAVGWNASNER